MYKFCPPIISDHPASMVLMYLPPIFKGKYVIKKVDKTGKNHIDPANPETNTNDIILDFKYKDQTEII